MGNFLEPPNSGHLWTTATFLGSQGWPLCSGLTVCLLTYCLPDDVANVHSQSPLVPVQAAVLVLLE